MKESSRLFLFPDINVWLALTYERHVHHKRAREWFDSLAPTARLFFCRITQLGLLRLLTSQTVMQADHPLNQREAWDAYDQWSHDERIEFLAEPEGFEAEFRRVTRSQFASNKDWADSYLVAFGQAARLTIVTFDRGLKGKAKGTLLLQA